MIALNKAADNRLIATFDVTSVVKAPTVFAVSVEASGTPDEVRKNLRLLMRNELNYRPGMAWPDRQKALKACEQWMDDLDLSSIV